MAVSDYDELLRKLLPPGMALDACNQPEAAELVNKTAVELHAAADLELIKAVCRNRPAHQHAAAERMGSQLRPARPLHRGAANAG